MIRPVVHLYTVCWDEADLLGFFFRHYDPFVDRYVIYDDGSTDGSRERLSAHPKVELRDFDRVDPDSFVLSHKAMQDEAWKASRGQADWVVVTAIDEHLHVRERTMAEYLAEQAAQGVTLIPALGFDMNHLEMPEDHGLLTERITRGRPRIAFNKLSIFDPDAVRESGFGPGRHAAEPAGKLRLPARDEMMLWHYKHLGFERNAERELAQARRLGSTDAAQGYGQHYLWGRERLRAFWDDMENDSSDLAVEGFNPDQTCIRPLWWEAGSDCARVMDTVSRRTSPNAAPTVSVLIKSYNHAPYIAQTIASVLDQSFQDFEIVVTDDASSDATAEIVRGFDDPRIRLEVLPFNHGISGAMNATIARARGRYLAILNSDDWALPGRLARQTAFLDENPNISLVFGMPYPVDELGDPTKAYNDFEEPLRWLDLSRRTFLQKFFFEGNCLCAPTAMIRREAYEATGAYDSRLTNLQDLDMWIRMLIAGHDIHVLAEPMTAFRIRANNANASAPSRESKLRGHFETIKILGQFAKIDKKMFCEIFDLDENYSTASIAVQVAEIAHLSPRNDHQNFALDCLYESAKTPKEIELLRSWAGSLDICNIFSVDSLNDEIEFRDRTNAHLKQLISDRNLSLYQKNLQMSEFRAEYHLHVANLSSELEQRQFETELAARRLEKVNAMIADLQSNLSAALASKDHIMKSWSWRSTAFIRWIERRTKR